MQKKIVDEIQYLFMIKKKNFWHTKNGSEPWFNLIQDINPEPKDNIILNGETLEIFSLKSETRQGYLLRFLLFHMVLEVQGTTIK